MTTEEITLTPRLLGAHPFILLTFHSGAGPDDLRINIEAGGGPTDREDIRTGLLLALSEMGPFTPDEIEMLTTAAGEGGS